MGIPPTINATKTVDLKLKILNFRRNKMAGNPRIIVCKNVVSNTNGKIITTHPLKLASKIDEIKVKHTAGKSIADNIDKKVFFILYDWSKPAL